MPATTCVLIVIRAAAVNDAVLADGAEGVGGPLLLLHADDVGVAHDQEGPLGAGAFDARHQVGARRVEREQLARECPRVPGSL